MPGLFATGRLAQRLRLSGSQALALTTVITNVVRIGSTMVLSRLLSPDVYGITGMILSVFYVINLLSDVGFQAYIVRHERSDDPHFLSAVWTIHATRGIVLTAVGVLLAWPVSKLLWKPELALPLAVASLVFAIDGLASLHPYRALRKGRVPRFALLNLVGAVGQTSAAILLAIFIRNVWAIVGSMLIASTLRVWLSHILFSGDRHLFRRDREVTADLWRFGRMIAASSALTLIITQVDKLAMGRILSLSQFGTYVLASSIAAAPTAFAINYAATIVYPAAAAASRNKASISEAYYGCWGRFFYAYAFAGGALIGIANLVIRFLYDARYLPAARYLAILAVGTALTMATWSMQEMLVGSGRTRATLELNVARLAWLLLGGGIALVQLNAMIFVLTIGLMECPAYLYGLWRMQRLRLVSWRREAALALTISVGFAGGSAASTLGKVFLPNL